MRFVYCLFSINLFSFLAGLCCVSFTISIAREEKLLTAFSSVFHVMLVNYKLSTVFIRTHTWWRGTNMVTIFVNICQAGSGVERRPARRQTMVSVTTDTRQGEILIKQTQPDGGDIAAKFHIC